MNFLTVEIDRRPSYHDRLVKHLRSSSIEARKDYITRASFGSLIKKLMTDRWTRMFVAGGVQ